MPIHDWTRVSAGTFHHFHNACMNEISNALNGGLLPKNFYAMTEQFAGDVGPDVLALHAGRADDVPEEGPPGASTVATAPPKVRFTAEAESAFYVAKQRSLVIRHASDDRVVALIEIVSQGNKSNRRRFRAFLDKAVAALSQGCHLLLIDVQPPTSRDPQDIHGALWAEISDDNYQAPPEKPLTLAAYAASLPTTRAYIEQVAVGDALPSMPLFLSASSYIQVPLEKSYESAYRGVPEKYRAVLESKH